MIPFHIHKYWFSAIQVILMEGLLLGGHLFIGLISPLCFHIFNSFQSMIEYVLRISQFLQFKLAFLWILRFFYSFSVDVLSIFKHLQSIPLPDGRRNLGLRSTTGLRLGSARIQSVDSQNISVQAYLVYLGHVYIWHVDLCSMYHNVFNLVHIYIYT